MTCLSTKDDRFGCGNVLKQTQILPKCVSCSMITRHVSNMMKYLYNLDIQGRFAALQQRWSNDGPRFLGCYYHHRFLRPKFCWTGEKYMNFFILRKSYKKAVPLNFRNFKKAFRPHIPNNFHIWVWERTSLFLLDFTNF